MTIVEHPDCAPVLLCGARYHVNGCTFYSKCARDPRLISVEIDINLGKEGKKKETSREPARIEI